MDPLEITSSQWNEISFALLGLWSALGFGVIAAFSFFFGHAIIPSAVSTRTISAKFSFLRPILYITGIGSFVLVLASLGFFLINLGWLMDFFPRFWQ